MADLGNIQGGPFEDWVTNQIYERQLSLGRGSGSNPKDLLYQQSKTPFLRLASSVDFETTPGIGIIDRLKRLPDIDAESLEGDIAAKSFILQGGAISSNNPLGTPDLNSGLNTPANRIDNLNGQLSGAYGWGGTTERGFIPMPGITGASVKYENDGALTKTTINIKCYSKTQLALVDALYMRPGYTLLLEFGWSTYLKTNDGDTLLKTPINPLDTNQVELVNQSPFKTLPLDYLLNNDSSNKNQYTIIQKIKAERKRQSGNYEAVFGKIVNFKWSLNDDGSYDCEVHLRGLGEVIESLKMNTNTSTDEGVILDTVVPPDVEEEEEEKKDEIPLVSNANKTTLNKCLYAIYQNARKETGYKQFSEREIPPPEDGETYAARLLREGLNALISKSAALSGLLANFAGVSLDIQGEDIIQDYSINNMPYLTKSGTYLNGGISIKKGVMALTNTTTGTDNYSPQVYITFGLLLALIQKNIVPKNPSNGVPIFMFGMNFSNLQTDDTVIRRLPGQFSCNPFKFIIPASKHGLGTGVPFFPTFENDINPAPFNNFVTANAAAWQYGNKKYLARLANIYVNTSYIANVMQDEPMISNDVQRNEKNSLDFLNTILKDININLGGINAIKMIVPDGGGTVEFTENIPQEETISHPREKFCKFNTFGFSRGTPNNTAGSPLNDQRQGSIVRNIGIDASIPSNFSTMISIGSQNNGNQASGNATSFSNYNNGLIDRIIPQKVVENVATPTSTGADTVKSPQELISDIVKELTTSNAIAELTKGLDGIADLSGGVYRDIYLQRQWYGDDLETFTELASTYHQYLSGLLTQPAADGGTGQLKAPFFLPFNLSLELDGISGIVMMQRFEIDQKILPPSYDPDSVELIIKTVDHEITPSSWVTKLGTSSVPLIKLASSTPEAAPNSPSNPPSNTNPTDTNNPTVAEEVVENLLPNADDAFLRLRLTRLYDDGNQTLGILDILAEDESTIRFSLPTVEQSFKDNQNRLSCVPQDRYLMSQSNGGGYGPHFQLYANQKNSYSPQELKDGDGSNVRTDIFIIPRWNYSQLQGSIGVGLTYNTLTNQAVNSSETGLGPSVNAAQAATPSADALKQILSQLGNLKEFFLDIEGTPNNNKDSFINTAKSNYFWENPDTSGPDLSGGEELPSNYA